jgi:hypothetical protein
MPEFLANLTTLQWIGLGFVALFLVKRVFKWALILGIVLVVAAPYLSELPVISDVLATLS